MIPFTRPSALAALIISLSLVGQSCGAPRIPRSPQNSETSAPGSENSATTTGPTGTPAISIQSSASTAATAIESSSAVIEQTTVSGTSETAASAASSTVANSPTTTPAAGESTILATGATGTQGTTGTPIESGASTGLVTGAVESSSVAPVTGAASNAAASTTGAFGTTTVQAASTVSFATSTAENVTPIEAAGSTESVTGVSAELNATTPSNFFTTLGNVISTVVSTIGSAVSSESSVATQLPTESTPLAENATAISETAAATEATGTPMINGSTESQTTGSVTGMETSPSTQLAAGTRAFGSTQMATGTGAATSTFAPTELATGTGIVDQNATSSATIGSEISTAAQTGPAENNATTFLPAELATGTAAAAVSTAVPTQFVNGTGAFENFTAVPTQFATVTGVFENSTAIPTQLATGTGAFEVSTASPTQSATGTGTFEIPTATPTEIFPPNGSTVAIVSTSIAPTELATGTGAAETTTSVTNNTASNAIPESTFAFSTSAVEINATTTGAVTEEGAAPSPGDLEAPTTEASNLGGSTTKSGSLGGSTEAGNGIGHRVNASVFDCTIYGFGRHVNPSQPCDQKYFICDDDMSLGYEQPCPAHLYYDGEIDQCVAWINVPACSGSPRPTVLTTEPSNVTLTTVTPVVDCSNKTNGNYLDPIGTIKPGCSNRFYKCENGKTTESKCPGHLIYDDTKDRCDFQQRVFACTGIVINDTVSTNPPLVTLPPADFDCSIKGFRKFRPEMTVIPPFGFYSDRRDNCSNTFFACSGDRATELHCPEGLVFDEEVGDCLAPSDVFACTGVRKTTPIPTTTEPANITSSTPSPMDCVGVPDGIYPDPLAACSREFYFCAHNVSFQKTCPANLYYNAEFKRCDLWLDVFECSGLHMTSPKPPTQPSPPPTVPTTDFDCSKMKDGMYVNPKNNCSKFYYFCANSQAYQQYCAADLFYDPDRKECASWINVYACSGRTQPPTTPVPSPGTLGSTEKPKFDCTPLLDGLYEHPDNSCSHVYFECSGGITYEFNCPANTYFSIATKKCDYYDNVFACSGKTPAPTTSTISVSHSTPAKLPIDCLLLEDGDYEDPVNNCSDKYYTCGGGIAYVRSCPTNTKFDADLKICNIPSQVPACSGKPRATTTSGPVTTRTPQPVYPFDCTKRYDGYYPDSKCSPKYWSCNGGLTAPHECAIGTIYDKEFNRCEFPYLLPECGGQRVTSSTRGPTTTSKPLPLDCTFLEDGSYPDPESNCSQIFYKCSNGKTSINPCPAELYYDSTRLTCDHHDQVSACTGETIIPTVATSPMNELSTSIAPTGSVETGSTGLPESTTTLGPIANETTAGSMATGSTVFPELTTTAAFETTSGSIVSGSTAVSESTTMGPIGNATTAVTGPIGNATSAFQTTAVTESLAPETPLAESTTAGAVLSTVSLELGSTAASNETTLIPTGTVVASTGTVSMINESSAATQPIGESTMALSTGATGEFTTANITESTTSGTSLPPAETTTGNVTELATSTASLSATTAGNVTELATGSTMIGETTPVSGTESVTNASETTAATGITASVSLPMESTLAATSGFNSTELSTLESILNTTAAVNTQPEGTGTSGLTTASGNATEQLTTIASITSTGINQTETSANSETTTTTGPGVSGATETTNSQHVTELSSFASTSASGLTSTVASQNATELHETTPAIEISTASGSETTHLESSSAVGSTTVQSLTSTLIENATTVAAVSSETSHAAGTTIAPTTGFVQNATTLAEISTSFNPTSILNNPSTETIGTGSPPPPPTSP